MSLSESPEDIRLLELSINGFTQPIPKKSLQIRTDKPRPHLCVVCTRGFARLEHLKRHERAHTNEKPYQCAACGRCFARRDLALRHQQKLHLKIFSVARRGLLPATLSHVPKNDTPELSSTNEKVIILRKNTDAKAPLPDLLNVFASSVPGPRFLDFVDSSLLMASPKTVSVHSRAEEDEDESAKGAKNIPKSRAPATIPSPTSTSHHNTPSLSGVYYGASAGFSDLDMLQNHNVPLTDYTQQPSPLTGDSPADTAFRLKQLKEKQRQEYLNDQLEFKSSLDLKNFSVLHKSTQANTRHASFSAVSGLSYTNLQDALAIRNTPEQSLAGVSEMDFADNHGPGMVGMDFDLYSMNFSEPQKAQISELNLSGTSPRKPPKSSSAGFKMSLKMIPSESHMAGLASSAFLHESANGNDAIAAHQFLNPDHPHHIPETTSMNFDYSMYKDPFNMQDLAHLDYSTGFPEHTPDLLLLQDHDDTSVQLNNGRSANNGISTDAQKQTSPTDPRKRRKVGFANHIDDLTWLEQFKGIPLSNDILLASTEPGFLGMPFVKDEFQSDEVFSLFKMKQDDFARQRRQLDLKSVNNPGLRIRTGLTVQVHLQARAPFAACRTSRAQFTIGNDPQEFISDDLRAKIVDASHISDAHFPPKNDLNGYMALYGEEFNTYFLFIHLPTLKNPMVDNFENIPMILAMCAIGALYSYHASNTLLLFNLSKFHIHRFFEREVTPSKLLLKKVPIMPHQCLVLHIFISMFLNEPNMVEITRKQMTSMVGLIRSTNFHRPLEQFLLPPPPMTNPNDITNLRNNFEYFIVAQTRIRTILTFYQLQVIRSILVGCALPMAAAELESGIHCKDETLWKAADCTEWYALLAETPDTDIVGLSNSRNLQELAEQLKGAKDTDWKSSFNKSMALLMYVHEQILAGRSTDAKAENDPFLWRTETRAQLHYLILSWEEYFVRNGGSVIVTNHNGTVLNTNIELKLILPLLWLAKIRVCVDFSPVTSSLLSRDWTAMSRALANLETDPEGLFEGSKYALDILELWIHNISEINDAKQTSERTPVFFLTSVFISVMILAKSIDTIESGKAVSVSEKALWLNCARVFRTIETTLRSHEQLSCFEFLNRQSGGIFDFSESRAFQKNVASLCLGEKSLKPRQLKKCKLLTHLLGLGVRILADAPLWPLAMRFAEALKHMAMDINGRA